MFKNFQSYVTPILLSHVDKYIKDFRPEDFQLSLWDGYVSLYNLDIRPDAIQDELNLPFSLSSGHIHELIIHVPWMKILYEPIVVTINTIECVLKLVDGDHKRPPNPPKPPKTSELETPPGVVQSLINRIVNNIAFRCNNVILKYVEEDIVISINIKQFYLDNVDGNWVPKYAEITADDLHVRKLISLSDLTLCLDKRNAAGKIETYLEPLLYKCEVVFKLDNEYGGMLNKKPKYTRMHIHSPKLELNLSYQQIPMVIRIFALFKALRQNRLGRRDSLDSLSRNSSSKSSGLLSFDAGNASDIKYEDTWSGWMWSFVDPFPSVDEDDEQNKLLHNNPNLLFSINIDVIIFSFKVPEVIPDVIATYTGSQRKIRYTNIGSLELKKISCETSSHGFNRFCFRGGVHHIAFYPEHVCTCGISDMNSERKKVYFESVIVDDAERPPWPVEFDSESTVEPLKEEEMLAICPAFAISYIYHLSVSDNQSDNITVSSDLEYSNYKEDVSINIALGPAKLIVCSGLVHRLTLLKSAADSYDYIPYFASKPMIKRQDLPPATTDDYDALSEYVPKYSISFIMISPKIRIVPWDHYATVKPECHFDGSGVMSANRRKVSTVNNERISAYYKKLRQMPWILIELKSIKFTKTDPMYPNRLTYVACQLPDPPAIMLDACYSYIKVDIEDLRAYLTLKCLKTLNNPSDISLTSISEESLKPSDINTLFITECNFQMTSKSLLHQEYWSMNESMTINDYNVNIENISVCVTLAKLYTLYHIMQNLFPPSESSLDIVKNEKLHGQYLKEHQTLFTTTLLKDAFENKDTVHLDLNFEGISFRKIALANVYTHRLVLNAARFFAIDSSTELTAKQVWILSAPESTTTLNAPFFKAVFQMSSKDDPSFLTLKTEQSSFLMDPLLFQWLTYKYKPLSCVSLATTHVTDNLTSASVNQNAVQKRPGRRSLDEIVNRIGGSSKTLNRLSLGQSSSDREKDFVHGTAPNADTNQTKPDSAKEKSNSPLKTAVNIDEDSNPIVNAAKRYFELENLALCLEIESIIVHFPTRPVSAVNFDSIYSAIRENVLDPTHSNVDSVLVLRLPTVTLKSSTLKHNLLNLCVYGLPVKFPSDIWDCGIGFEYTGCLVHRVPN